MKWRLSGSETLDADVGRLSATEAEDEGNLETLDEGRAPCDQRNL